MSQDTAYTGIKEFGSFVIVALNGSTILYMMWHFVFQAHYWVEKKIRGSNIGVHDNAGAEDTGGRVDVELTEMNPVAMDALDQEEEDRKDLMEVGVGEEGQEAVESDV